MTQRSSHAAQQTHEDRVLQRLRADVYGQMEFFVNKMERGSRDVRRNVDHDMCKLREDVSDLGTELRTAVQSVNELWRAMREIQLTLQLPAARDDERLPHQAGVHLQRHVRSSITREISPRSGGDATQDALAQPPRAVSWSRLEYRSRRERLKRKKPSPQHSPQDSSGNFVQCPKGHRLKVEGSVPSAPSPPQKEEQQPALVTGEPKSEDDNDIDLPEHKDRGPYANLKDSLLSLRDAKTNLGRGSEDEWQKIYDNLGEMVSNVEDSDVKRTIQKDMSEMKANFNARRMSSWRSYLPTMLEVLGPSEEEKRRIRSGVHGRAIYKPAAEKVQCARARSTTEGAVQHEQQTVAVKDELLASDDKSHCKGAAASVRVKHEQRTKIAVKDELLSSDNEGQCKGAAAAVRTPQ